MDPAGYPPPPATVGQQAPVPRRIRGVRGGRTVLDTVRAVYVWEWPFYPQYYVPRADIDAAVLADEHAVEASLDGLVHLRWDALEAWYEEDEQVFVHPRNPYTRVDALRSTRHVRISLDDEVLAESSAPVLVFETGLPTRYYLNPTEVEHDRLIASDTMTACPYKGRTSGYWSVRTRHGHYPDLAWSYDFPTRELAPVAGLIAFLNESVDLEVDGVALPRPSTHFA